MKYRVWERCMCVYTPVGMPDIVLNMVCFVCASRIFHALFGLNLIEWFFLGISNFDSITILDGRMLNTIHSDRGKNAFIWNKVEEKWNILLWMCTNVITKKYCLSGNDGDGGVISIWPKSCTYYMPRWQRGKQSNDNIQCDDVQYTKTSSDYQPVKARPRDKQLIYVKERRKKNENRQPF